MSMYNYVAYPNKIIEIIRFNILNRGIPIHASKWTLFGWTDGIDVPREGEWLLFTGFMYQLTPYIEVLVDKLSRIKNGFLLTLGSMVNKVFDISRFISTPPRERIMEVHDVLRNIYRLLVASGYRVWYDEAIDTYPGTLLYEFGLDAELKYYGERLYHRLKSRGVDRIITVDPHTTYILKKVYPSIVPNYDVKVLSYLELIDPSTLCRVESELVYAIHDPCYYARGIGLYQGTREALASVGVRVVEPRFSGTNTYCCGGPIESLSPTFSAEIGRRRLDMLLRTGADKIIVMCPICMANLRRASSSDNIIDISQLLKRANTI